jgi:ABC-2 type transport system permease protein
MTARLERLARVYGAIAAMVPKLYLAYSIWAWMEFVVQILAMAIYAAFWRAVYASAGGTGSLFNYILLAQIILPLMRTTSSFTSASCCARPGRGRLVRRSTSRCATASVLASLVLFVLLKIPLTWSPCCSSASAAPRPAVWAAFALAWCSATAWCSSSTICSPAWRSPAPRPGA